MDGAIDLEKAPRQSRYPDELKILLREYKKAGVDNIIRETKEILEYLRKRLKKH